MNSDSHPTKPLLVVGMDEECRYIQDPSLSIYIYMSFCIYSENVDEKKKQIFFFFKYYVFRFYVNVDINDLFIFLFYHSQCPIFTFSGHYFILSLPWFLSTWTRLFEVNTKDKAFKQVASVISDFRKEEPYQKVCRFSASGNLLITGGTDSKVCSRSECQFYVGILYFIHNFVLAKLIFFFIILLSGSRLGNSFIKTAFHFGRT